MCSEALLPWQPSPTEAEALESQLLEMARKLMSCLPLWWDRWTAPVFFLMLCCLCSQWSGLVGGGGRFVLMRRAEMTKIIPSLLLVLFVPKTYCRFWAPSNRRHLWSLGNISLLSCPPPLFRCADVTVERRAVLCVCVCVCVCVRAPKRCFVYVRALVCL